MEFLNMILDGAGLLSFIGTVLVLIFNRRKVKAEANKLIAETNEINDKSHAEIEKLVAETEQIRFESQKKMQNQLDELREQNKKLFIEREIERDAKEKLRRELDRLHESIDMLRRELQTERARNGALIIEAEKQRNNNLEKMVRIEGLEALVAQQQKTITSLQEQIANIKRTTGDLSVKLDKKETAE